MSRAWLALIALLFSGCWGQSEKTPPTSSQQDVRASLTGLPEVIIIKPHADTECKRGGELEVEAEVRVSADGPWIPLNVVARLEQGSLQWGEYGHEVNPKKEKISLRFSKVVPVPERKGSYRLRVLAMGMDTSRPLGPATGPGGANVPTGASQTYESEAVTIHVR